MCAQRITEVIVFGMEAYIPHTFSPFHAKKPWFNHACCRAIKDREAVYRRYLSIRTPDAHNLYISTRNLAISILRLAINSLINRKYQNLFNSNSSKYFWHQAKNIFNFTSSSFPPLLKSDGTTSVTSVTRTLFANSTLNDSGHIPPTLLWLLLKFFTMFSVDREKEKGERIVQKWKRKNVFGVKYVLCLEALKVLINVRYHYHHYSIRYYHY